jgi:TonB family protein
MTGKSLAVDASGAPSRKAGRPPIELRIEDRLGSLPVPIRNMSAVTVGVLVGSLAVHVALLAIAVVTGPAPAPVREREISVEIVRDVPPARMSPPKKPATPPASMQEAKAAPPQPDHAKPETAKPETAKAETAKAEAGKLPDAPKAVTPTPTPPRPVASTAPPKQESAPQAPPADARQVEALKRELADLKAQHEALEAAARAQPAPDPAEPTSGPLADSLHAVALPSVGDGPGDVVGYQQLVFSQLAKAKGDGEYNGEAGTTGVRFEVDAAGRLLSVAIAASSGNATLDAQALEIVRRAAPFPAPPKDAEHSFLANVNFVPAKRS